MFEIFSRLTDFSFPESWSARGFINKSRLKALKIFSRLVIVGDHSRVIISDFLIAVTLFKVLYFKYFK